MATVLEGRAVPRLSYRPLGLREWINEMVEDSFRMHDVYYAVSRPQGIRIEDDLLFWSRCEQTMISPPDATRCLWDFVALADAPQEQIAHFLAHWGTWQFHESGPNPVDEWREFASMVHSWLSIFLDTLQGVVVDEAVLWKLRDGIIGGPQRPGYEQLEAEMERLRERFPSADHDHLWQTAKQHHQERWDRERRAYIRSVRAAGNAIDLQQELVSGWLSHWTMGLEGPYQGPYWRKDGRGIGSAAMGVKQIVFAQLLRIFAAAEPVVYTCDVCGTLFEWTPEHSARRPRRDRKCFCSDACRKNARRASNRASWHRNKAEWGRPGV